MLLLDEFQMSKQLGADDGGQRRDAVLVALTGADDDLLSPEIDVLHAEAGTFEETQAGAVHENRHEAGSTAELTDDGPHLVSGEHHG